jgi:aspartokinase-like uncharacterized kinase
MTERSGIIGTGSGGVNTPGPAAINVVKIGGALSAIPAALDRVCTAVGQAGRSHRILVVPGGGPFAETVRQFEHAVGLSSDAAHWMAVLGMDQYAHVLAERIPGAVLVEEPGSVCQATIPTGVAVLAPSRWMRSADVLPHSWEVTSDSIAAFVAGAMDAARLVLIKTVAEPAEPVDPYFATALPSGMPFSVLGCDQLDELPARLTG